MDARKMKAAGNVLYSRSIHPILKPRAADVYLVGFDTEYTSRGNELLSVQLSFDGRAAFIPWPRGKKLTPRFLWQESVKLVGRRDRTIVLVTFFSLAELQFLPVLTEGFHIREYARGSLDCCFAIRGQSARLEIFDLGRWFDGKSLAAAAESLGLEKLEWNRRKVTRACLRSAAFRRYAIRDAELCEVILSRLRNEFIGETGVDPVSAKTPASASACAFRHLHVKRDLWCDDNRARYVACRATWGGHAEVFRRGRLRGIYAEYDLTSAYPTSAIALGEMPVQKSWREVSSLREVERMRGGFVECAFKFKAQEQYPCLPVWHNDMMLFPLEGMAWCTFEEIKRALEMGAHVRVLEGKGYRHGTKALSEYLAWTLEKRQDSKGAGRVMWKLLGNSIIGKFAQQVSRVSIDEYYRLAEENGYYLDELFELSTDELVALGAHHTVSVGPVFMPEWNGLITGYTRAALSEMLSSGKAVYCHTDSTWCQNPPKCGRLKFETKGYGRVIIARTRFASLGAGTQWEHVAHHSIWSKAAAKQMLARFDGQDILRRYPIRRPLKLRESIRDDRPLGKWVEEWRCGNTKWDGKRKLLPGGETRPWRNIGEFELDRARNTS